MGRGRRPQRGRRLSGDMWRCIMAVGNTDHIECRHVARVALPELGDHPPRSSRRGQHYEPGEAGEAGGAVSILCELGSVAPSRGSVSAIRFSSRAARLSRHVHRHARVRRARRPMCRSAGRGRGPHRGVAQQSDIDWVSLTRLGRVVRVGHHAGARVSAAVGPQAEGCRPPGRPGGGGWDCSWRPGGRGGGSCLDETTAAEIEERAPSGSWSGVRGGRAGRAGRGRAGRVSSVVIVAVRVS